MDATSRADGVGGSSPPPLALTLVYVYTAVMAYDKATGFTGFHDPFSASTIKDCDDNAKAYSEPSETIVNGPDLDVTHILDVVTGGSEQVAP